MKRGLCAVLIALTLAIWGLTISQVRAETTFTGKLQQGALVIGKTEPGSKASLDGAMLMISPEGLFAFGFDRDNGPVANLTIIAPDGQVEKKTLPILPRAWDIQRVDGVASKYVSPPPEDLARIRRDSAKKNAARPADTEASWFARKFIWPARGTISGVFGSQRIFNGEPRRPHYGVDMAAPTGTEVVAPAEGIVRLAERDMFFEGGLIFLDHGQGVISLMMHMSRIDVKVGQHVRQGDALGAVGQSGRTTGPHLHWGMYWRKAHLDPALLVAEPGPRPGDEVGNR